MKILSIHFKRFVVRFICVNTHNVNPYIRDAAILAFTHKSNAPLTINNKLFDWSHCFIFFVNELWNSRNLFSISISWWLQRTCFIIFAHCVSSSKFFFYPSPSWNRLHFGHIFFRLYTICAKKRGLTREASEKKNELCLARGTYDSSEFAYANWLSCRKISW